MFAKEFENYFLEKEKQLKNPTVWEIWEVFKLTSRALKIEQADIGSFSFYGSLSKYAEEAIFEITLYYNDLNSWYSCCFTAEKHPTLDNLSSAEVLYGKETGNLEDIFKRIEAWTMFKEFESLKLNYSFEKEE